MTTNNLKRVFVFIASPGDVSNARNSVRYAVERINKLLAKDNGFLLEPIGWEDVPPGKGKRAQDIINPYVDSASIFMIMYRESRLDQYSNSYSFTFHPLTARAHTLVVSERF